MKIPIAMEKFFDAVFHSWRKTKVAKDSRSSLDTTVPDQNLDHGRDNLGLESTAAWSQITYSNNNYSNSGNIVKWDDHILFYSPITASKKKRWPHTGSNISKPPTLFEFQERDPFAPPISSKTQKDTKPIKNWLKVNLSLSLHEFAFPNYITWIMFKIFIYSTL